MSFEQFLETVNIEESEKQILRVFRKNIANHGKACKTIFVHGCVGVGKTELAKNIISGAPAPIIYWGPEPEKGYVSCKNRQELIESVKKHEKSVIFIDNAGLMLRDCHCSWELSKEDEQAIYEVINMVKSSSCRSLILIDAKMLKGAQGIMDRMDVKIKIDVPEKEPKKALIKSFCPGLPEELVSYISRKTIGYTFRDIQNIIKMLKSSGKAITLEQIKEILTKYVPAAFEAHKISHVTDMDFSKIVSRDGIKDKLNIALMSIRNKEFASQAGISPKNLLFFYGAPGTGKTFMAKAIAGELGQPIITINASCINSRNASPNELLKGIMELGARFGDCILLFDEAEKIFGKSIVGEDEHLQGDLQSHLDGVSGKMKSLIIFTLNEEARFGAALKDRFLMFKFDLPTKEERAEFLKKKHESAKSHFSISADMWELAQEIGDSSFREVEKVWDHTLLRKMIANETEVGMDNFMETIAMLKSKSGENYFG
ncbi:MAG: ATP-binding protein [Nanoarchaeota archaeon]|nr:ATP-binding protein [Nanoarchaeota archaeon]